MAVSEADVAAAAVAGRVAERGRHEIIGRAETHESGAVAAFRFQVGDDAGAGRGAVAGELAHHVVGAPAGRRAEALVVAVIGNRDVRVIGMPVDFIRFGGALIDLGGGLSAGPLLSRVPAGRVDPEAVYEVGADPRFPRTDPGGAVPGVAGSRRHEIMVVPRVQQRRAGDRFQVVHAARAAPAFARLVQCGQQHPRQNRDDVY